MIFRVAVARPPAPEGTPTALTTLAFAIREWFDCPDFDSKIRKFVQVDWEDNFDFSDFFETSKPMFHQKVNGTLPYAIRNLDLWFAFSSHGKGQNAPRFPKPWNPNGKRF